MKAKVPEIPKTDTKTLTSTVLNLKPPGLRIGEETWNLAVTSKGVELATGFGEAGIHF